MFFLFRSEETQQTSRLLEQSDPPLAPFPTTTNTEMTVASKEVSPEKAEGNEEFVNARPIDEGVISSMYSFAKKAATVGIVYFVGYMGWSVAWLIGPVILSVIRDQWKQQSDRKRNDAKFIATTDERRVILARLNDLPSWVSFFFVYLIFFFLTQEYTQH